jgi:hypothetical protein
MENLIEDILTEAVTEVSEGAIGRGLKEVETAEKAKPGIIAKR